MSGSYRQEQVIAELEAADGLVIAQQTLLRRVYGVADPRTEAALRNVLHRLRRSRPDLEIERVRGFRLRRDGTRLDRARES